MPKRRPREVEKIAMLALGALVIVAAPPQPGAQQEICPQFLAAYCVAQPGGARMTMQTNPCLARQRGFEVVRRGACGQDGER
ncbi:MAG: hypothetical protein WAK03_07945 [Methylocystis sp.]|jgi:hypothetical protein